MRLPPVYVTRIWLLLALGYSALAPRVGAEDAQQPQRPWWHKYSTIASHPGERDLNKVHADCYRAAGWYGGWYGFWYSDFLTRNAYCSKMWERVKELGAKPAMYFDAGEVGDFVVLLDENNRILYDGWSWSQWKGEEGAPHWFGMEAFMDDVPWAPYPTAKDYGLKPFTMPTGEVIPPGKLYDVLSVRWINDTWHFDYFTNDRVTDEMAGKSGLATLSQRQAGGKNVRMKTGWNTGRLISIDHTNPQLRDYHCREMEFCIKKYRPSGIHIDNLGDMNVFCPSIGSFGIWTSYTEREFLKNHFTPDQLTKMGVDDIDTYEVREYMAKSGSNPADPRWVDDLLWKCHLINKIERGLEWHGALYQTAKKTAEQEGLDCAVFGNVIPLFPDGGFMRGNCDIAHFEWKSKGAYPDMPELGLPPKACIAYVTRLGAKLGQASYCWPSLYVPKELTGPAHQNLHKIQAFDCLANRGIMDYGQWYLDNYSAGTEESAGFINRFIETNAPRISGREYLADIALAYCPWTNLAAMNALVMLPELFLNEYKGWSDFLCSQHYQWDVILSDDIKADVLRKYPIVVLPSIMVITEAQADELAKYVSEGGRLVGTGLSGTRQGKDGYLMRRDVNALDGIKREPTVKITTDKPGAAYWTSGGNAAAMGQLNDLLRFEGFEPRVTTDAPECVEVNLNVGTGERATLLTVDLNNNALDVESDVVTPTQPFSVSMKLPERFAEKDMRVSYACPTAEDSRPPLPFPAEDVVWDRKPGRLTLKVPAFEFYMIIYLDPVAS